MRSISFCSSLVVAGMSLIVMTVTASSVGAQVVPDSVVPVISARTYVSGSVTVIVKGSFQMNQVIEINKPASISDGEMTWLQFGASGSSTGDVLVTYGEDIGDGVGVHVGKGKPTATAGSELCTGDLTITASQLSGHYTCAGVVSYDSSTGTMGKVDIEISFTAKS
ncbi:MAG TPA: hypothetical protein VGP80_13780 [Gemmatimonadales bacterium]|jgi:hypothetical protein|nr:hypothetical protein [Gemmatimonadales bacterium]